MESAGFRSGYWHKTDPFEINDLEYFDELIIKPKLMTRKVLLVGILLQGFWGIKIFSQQVQVIFDTASNITISRHIYGHFSEHLGHCIYGGFWVNDSLNVPKKNRIRMDIVDALRKINIPNLRWPG